MLCHRCEHRIRFIEKGRRPRCECGDLGHAVGCCYMYTPVNPVIMKKAEGDPRSEAAPAMLRARSRGCGVKTDLQPTIHRAGEGEYYIALERECTWTHHGEYMATSCGLNVQEMKATYCPHCGGRRKVDMTGGM